MALTIIRSLALTTLSLAAIIQGQITTIINPRVVQIIQNQAILDLATAVRLAHHFLEAVACRLVQAHPLGGADRGNNFINFILS